MVTTMLPASVSALLGSVETPDLLDYIWERLWSARPRGRYGMRAKVPPTGQLVLPCARYLFRVPVAHKPTVRDLPDLGWSPFAPGRWLDPETGIDRAEGLALIIERDRHGIEAETFEPMSLDYGDCPIALKKPGRPVSLPDELREKGESVLRREKLRQERKRKSGAARETSPNHSFTAGNQREDGRNGSNIQVYDTTRNPTE